MTSISKYSLTPIQRHPHLVSMKDSEQKFPVIQHFDLPPHSMSPHSAKVCGELTVALLWGVTFLESVCVLGC